MKATHPNNAQPEGKLVVDVDFGSIDVTTHETGEVVVDVWRRIARKTKADEEEFLRDHPVTFSQDGNTVTVRSRCKGAGGRSSNGRSRTEAKYTVTVPTQFNAQLKTSGGGIAVSNLVGEMKATTSGGGLTIENVIGEVEGSTSGGAVSAVLPSPMPGDMKLSTSAGGVTVVVPADAAFDLDASTSSGWVRSDLPVTVVGKQERDRLKGTLNGGGKSMVLRSSAGSIHLKKP